MTDALLPWQVPVAAEWLARRGRWPHAVLVAGPAGIGKRTLAEWLARTLLCEQPAANGTPCGECPSCRYASAGQHPDLRVVEPIDDDEENPRPVEWIVVDRIRTLVRWSTLTSHRGGAKVALIDPAERMNAAAANALLKTLEEPQPDTYFLLVTHQPGRLPATIVSRCQRLVVPLPERQQARGWLAAQGIADTDRLLDQAGGAPLVARAIGDASYQSEREAWLAAFAAPATLSVTALGARIDAGPREARRDRLAAVVGWLGAWCADLARVRAGGTPVHNPDFGRELAALAKAVAGVALFRYHRSLLAQRTLLAHPLQPRLVAEALLTDYQALFE